MTWGPFVCGLNAGEYIARVRSLTAIALVLAHDHPRLTESLRQAERDPAGLQIAQCELDELPALTRRRVISAYAQIAKPR